MSWITHIAGLHTYPLPAGLSCPMSQANTISDLVSRMVSQASTPGASVDRITAAVRGTAAAVGVLRRDTLVTFAKELHTNVEAVFSRPPESFNLQEVSAVLKLDAGSIAPDSWGPLARSVASARMSRDAPDKTSWAAVLLSGSVPRALATRTHTDALAATDSCEAPTHEDAVSAFACQAARVLQQGKFDIGLLSPAAALLLPRDVARDVIRYPLTTVDGSTFLALAARSALVWGARGGKISCRRFHFNGCIAKYARGVMRCRVNDLSALLTIGPALEIGNAPVLRMARYRGFAPELMAFRFVDTPVRGQEQARRRCATLGGHWAPAVPILDGDSRSVNAGVNRLLVTAHCLAQGSEGNPALKAFAAADLGAQCDRLLQVKEGLLPWHAASMVRSAATLNADFRLADVSAHLLTQATAKVPAELWDAWSAAVIVDSVDRNVISAVPVVEALRRNLSQSVWNGCTVTPADIVAGQNSDLQGSSAAHR
jgi:hypothetical protein